MTPPVVIASYPRSGSTWFRFILANLFYPTRDHTFDTVNRTIPPCDHEPGLLEAIPEPIFFKSHGLEKGGNIIYLARHVGDVLISEWHYKRKMHGDRRSLLEFLEACDYGKEWREHVDHYFPAIHTVYYREIGQPLVYRRLFPGRFDTPIISAALNKSSFDKMRSLEKLGMGSYPSGDPSIPFCRAGTSDQWKEMGAEVQVILLRKNAAQLKKLSFL